jgi:hypothetical protein
MLQRLLICCCLLGLVGGCGRPSGPPPTPAEEALSYFKSRQGATMTPHGKIRMDTVTVDDGKLRYTTQNGAAWTVTYTKQADGTYQYGTPEEVK